MTFVLHNRLHIRPSAIIVALLVATSSHAQTQTGGDAYFTGSVRQACEALLCLSSSAGGATSACDPALSHYYSIREKKLSDTLKARRNFLNQCPSASDSPAMVALADVISSAAGRCDSATLNASLAKSRTDHLGIERTLIGDQMPAYCNSYAQHQYTDLQDGLPRYVGIPIDGGYWVEPKNYEVELKKYQAALEARKKERDAFIFSN